MTTGTRQTGTLTSGDIYSYKHWSGADDPGKHKTENFYECWIHHRVRNQSHYSGDPARRCLDGYGYNVSCNVEQYPPWTNNDQLNVLGKLAQEARNADFQLGTFAAQGKQAVDQAVSTLAALGRAALSLKRGNVSDAMKQVGLIPGQRSSKRVKRKLDAGDVSGAWLAMQYGWLPTLSDVHAAWEAYKTLTAPPRSLTIRASGIKKRTFEASNWIYGWNAPGYSSDGRRLKVRMTEQLSTPRSLGLTDPLSVAWEVVPWSFVVDWFYPIGSYLEALNVIPRLGADAVDTRYLTASCKLGGMKGIYCSDALYSEKRVYIRRAPGQIVVPTPNFRSVPEAMSPKRIANAIALAHQRFR